MSQSQEARQPASAAWKSCFDWWPCFQSNSSRTILWGRMQVGWNISFQSLARLVSWLWIVLEESSKMGKHAIWYWNMSSHWMPMLFNVHECFTLLDQEYFSKMVQPSKRPLLMRTTWWEVQRFLTVIDEKHAWRKELMREATIGFSLIQTTYSHFLHFLSNKFEGRKMYDRACRWQYQRFL